MKPRYFIIMSAMLILLYSACSTSPSGTDSNISLSLLGTYETGLYDESGAEIVTWDGINERIIFVNANLGGISILDASTPAAPEKLRDVTFGEGEANSVDSSDEYIVVAVNAAGYGETPSKGSVHILSLDGEEVATVEAGYLPDMLTFTPDGKTILCANEGEPSDDYSTDPAGSITIIDVDDGFSAVTVGFEDVPLIGDVRISGPDGTDQAADMEPEYIAVDKEGIYAYASCQENNAIAKIDIESKSIIGVYGLGTVDHSVEGQGIDANKDGIAKVETWPLKGLFMPDALASFSVHGKNYIVSANEGDDREYGDYADAVKSVKADFDGPIFNPDDLTRLRESSIRLSAVNGDNDNDGLLEEAYSFGTRSFTIWDDEMNRIWNSDDFFEEYTVENKPDFIGVSNDNLAVDDRTEKKGPEPEAAETGVIDGRTYAFIGLEREGGIFTFDVTNPEAPVFKDYINLRNFEAVVDEEGEFIDQSVTNTGCLGPEGLEFVSAEESPTGSPLLIAGYEVSGSVAILEITM